MNHYPLSTSASSGYNFLGFNFGRLVTISKKLLFLLIGLCISFLLNAQVSKTVYVTAGNLFSTLSASELETITNLTLTGTIDARDFKTMRDNMPLLTGIDLSGTAVVDYYGTEGTNQYSYNYPADEIPELAVQNMAGLISVILPSSVASIRMQAFQDCIRLSSISIPSTVTSVENGAFWGCSWLSSISIPSSVTSIGDFAFEGCSRLNSIYANPLNPVDLSSGLFSEVFGRVNKSTCILYVPYATKELYATANQWKDFINIVEEMNGILPDPIAKSFSPDEGSVKVNISSNVKWTASSNQSWLTVNPTSPLPITGNGQLGLTAEANPTNITRTAIVTLSAKDVTSAKITITQEGTPKTINIAPGRLATSITAEELNEITNLSITGTIDARDFKTMRDMMPSLAKIDLSGAKIVAYNGPEGTKISNYYYPADEIPDYAFYIYNPNNEGKTSLTSILLPSSITSIGEWSFATCTGLTGALTIPSSVTSIGDYAFFSCTGLTGPLSIPSTVNYMGKFAFAYCSKLAGALVLPSSITSIGENTFIFCERLTGALTIPPLVTSIGESAFYGCSGFNGELTLPGSLISIGRNAFTNCRNLTGALTIPPLVTSIGMQTFEGCSGFSGKLTLPSSLTAIGGRAFILCSGLTGELNLPSSLKFIGESAFYGCVGFTGSLTIPNSVTSIEMAAFYNCRGFNGTLTLPFSLTSVNDHTFNGCSKLTGSVLIPSSVSSIGRYAFQECNSINSLTIPSSVTSIAVAAFNGCSGLNIIQPQSVIPIDLSSSPNVFSGVDVAICKLYVPDGSSNLYSTSDQWKDFRNIVEMSGFNLSATTVKLQSSEGSSATVDITSEISWTASSDQPWLTVSPSSGTGNETLTLSAPANMSNASRQATVTVGSGSSESQKITVFQDGAPEIPTDQKPLAIIRKTNVVPILDGFIDDVWSNATPNNIAVPFRTETPTLGALGETTWKALWNDEGIYVLVTVADDVFSPVYNGTDVGSWWMYDKTEMYFDCNPVKNDGRGTAENGNGHHYFFSAPIKDLVSSGGVLVDDANGLYFSYKVTGSGYVVEEFIPFSKLTDQNGAVVDKSQPIGFDITVVDNDLTTPNRNRMNWANNGVIDECWNNMDDAGLIQLDAGDPIAQIQVTKITLTPGSITTDNGTLQMNALIEPENATDRKLNWTVVNNAGVALVSETGLVTAILNGTVTVVAKATDGSQVEGTATIEISGQESEDPNSNHPDMYVTLASGKGTVQCFIGSAPNSPVSSDQSWLRVEPTTGPGEQQVRIEHDANPTNMPRMATVTVFQDGQVFQKIIITQEGKTDTQVNTGNSDFGPKWDSEVWNDKNLIKNGCFNNGLAEWTYWADPSVPGQAEPVISDGVVSMSTGLSPDGQKWHYLFVQQGMQAKANVPYTLKFKSWSSAPRTNSVVFEDTWENNYMRYGASSDPGSVNDRSEWDYSTTTEPRWFTFHVVFDMMNSNTVQKIQWMLATADATTYLDSVILVEDADIYSTGSVNLSLSAASLSMPETGSTAYVTITSNSNWTVNCDQPWISLNLLSGSGNGELLISTVANPEITDRNATVTVLAEGGISKRIIVTQNGKKEEPTDPGNSGNSFLPITYIYTSAELSSIPVDITPASNWEAIADQSWLDVSPQAGIGSQTLTLTTPVNPSYVPRTGTIVVFEDGIASQLFIVTQDGLELDQGNHGGNENNVDNPKKIKITGKKSSAIISISEEPSSVVSDQGWLKVNPLTASDDKTLSFNIEPNPTNVSRTALVTVYSNGVAVQTITITQDSGSSTVGISPVAANNSILAYPNPTSGKVKLIFDVMPQSGIQVTVFDFTGRAIIQQLIQDKEEWINLEGNSPGIYFIKTNLENLKVQKVILK
jgi:hypothetical protein